MSGTWVWETLGLDAGADVATIRRAYAQRLRETHPEDDSDAFQQLRAAYEHAMGLAHSRALRAQRPAREPRPEAPAPADDPPAAAPDEAAPEPQVDEAELEHKRRCDALHQHVQDGAAGAILQDALEKVLSSPAMVSIDVHRRTEWWLAQFIPSSMPNSDELIEPVVKFFGWAEERIGPPNQIAVGVLRRRQELEFLKRDSMYGAPDHAAYGALRNAPHGKQLRKNRMTPMLAEQVDTLLARLRAEHPGLLSKLNPEALAWWDKYKSKPRLGAVSIWLCLVAPPVIAFFVNASLELPNLGRFLSIWAGAEGVLLLGSILRVLLLEWPRRWWSRRSTEARPIWMALGWVAAAPALVLIAALLPPSMAATVILSVLSLAVAWWAQTTAEPDRRRDVGDEWWVIGPVQGFIVFYLVILVCVFLTQPVWHAGLRYHWRARALFAYAYVGIFWVLIAPVLGAAVMLQVTPALVLAAVAYVVGAQSIRDAWSTLVSSRARTWTYAAGLALVVAFGVTFWPATQSAALRPTLAALVAVVALVDRVIAWDLGISGFTFRENLLRFGWFGWLLAVSIAGWMGSWHGTLMVGGYWLLTGAVVTLIGQLTRGKPGAKRQPY